MNNKNLLIYLLVFCITNSMTEYLKPFILAIDEEHQITHLCIPDIGAECITHELIAELKDEYGINITIVPFDSSLFPPNISNGIYLLIDCMDEHNIILNIGRIQRKIKEALIKYKKLNPPCLPKCRKGDDIFM
jgi:hypothetical protein